MRKIDGAIHVAKIARNHQGKAYVSFLLRRTYRDKGKVKHQTLGNISHLPAHIIDMITGALRGESYLPASDSFEIIRSLPHGHVAAVLGTLKKIGLDKIISSRPSRELDLVEALIVARVIDPASKLATARGINADTNFTSLGQVLGIERTNEDDLYKAMDWIEKRQSRIETKIALKHLKGGTLVLYDLSSSYYTGKRCPLAWFGHNRDGKKRFPQINYGLLCNADGCPIAIEVFEGNTGDPVTFSAQVQKVRKKFGIEHIAWVGDRGMITAARIREDLAPKGLDWITALRAPDIQALASAGVVNRSLFDDRDLAEIFSPEYPNERLIACRNPMLAVERSVKRQELLAATEKLLNKVVEETNRKKNPLRGKDNIGVKVGKALNKFNVGKHFILNITDFEFSFKRNEERISREAALDGIYVIRTSLPGSALDARSTVERYKDLSKVERAFRSLKSIDLKIRPIFHRLPGRVRSHIFLCMLAYYVEWHMRKDLAPVLFDDDDKESARNNRESIVAPAKRSEKAESKARTKRTEDGEPVHSFQTLLKSLASITKNRIRLKSQTSSEFDQFTIPDQNQRRALDLLGIDLVL
jgi:transposase